MTYLEETIPPSMTDQQFAPDFRLFFEVDAALCVGLGLTGQHS